MFPPGRARLAANPEATGSLASVITMGIAFVAFFAASVAKLPPLTITSTLRPTSSAASSVMWSGFPSPYLHSMTISLPLHVPELAQALPERVGAGRHDRK